MTTTKKTHIGLDTSSFGFHWVSNDELPEWEPPLLGYSKVKGDVEERWVHIFLDALKFFKHLPDNSHVWCEEPLALPRNGKTTRILGISAGVIFGAFVAAGEWTDSTWYWVDVASWKRAVIGNGSANKELIRSVVREQEPWQESFAPYDDLFEDQRDLYDAYALMQYGYMTSAD